MVLAVSRVLWACILGFSQGDVRFKALKSAGEKKNVFQNFVAKKQR